MRDIKNRGEGERKEGDKDRNIRVYGRKPGL